MSLTAGLISLAEKIKISAVVVQVLLNASVGCGANRYRLSGGGEGGDAAEKIILTYEA